MTRFDIENFCKTIETKKVTYLAVAPPICVLLAKSPVPSEYDLSSLKRMISGAAPMTQELMKLVRERYDVVLKQGYGCSEITAGACAQVSLALIRSAFAHRNSLGNLRASRTGRLDGFCRTRVARSWTMPVRNFKLDNPVNSG
jgi:acyl-coenzyme A synthetase/AMP-(fatty) acid ligase